ncbi:microviridin/marinostatin family tricyclic proteinase inhibitor [Archangium minus]|uniref:Microviridin/marinostatin family tricyclic proteinase inhibitor n=1 Tax=Archangium minus TaxID=83450 RepID=A0ABY9WZU4_9BACT|nr:microviridin/marinostatin family tricyclic proteinase inhibitor [Archangium violaceum]WNG48653.1 microviridin/marinostatin family tricyclic proteinase inhibitor [Archangium minus]
MKKDKKNKQDTSQQKGKRPFFARLLEAQELEKVAGGAPMQTMKYPSDSDEEIPITKKFPSDCADSY